MQYNSSRLVFKLSSKDFKQLYGKMCSAKETVISEKDIGMDLNGKESAMVDVIASFISMTYGFAALALGGSNYRVGKVKVRLRKMLKILRYGSPSALVNLFDRVKLLLLNLIIISAAGEDGAPVLKDTILLILETEEAGGEHTDAVISAGDDHLSFLPSSVQKV